MSLNRIGFATIDEAMDAADKRRRDFTAEDGDRNRVWTWLAATVPGGGWVGRIIFESGTSLDVWPPRNGFPTMEQALEWGERKAKEYEGAAFGKVKRGIAMGWAAVTVAPPGEGYFVRCGFSSGPGLEVWPEDCGL